MIWFTGWRIKSFSWIKALKIWLHSYNFQLGLYRQVESQNTESGKNTKASKELVDLAWRSENVHVACIGFYLQTANLNSGLNKKQKLFVSTTVKVIVASVKNKNKKFAFARRFSIFVRQSDLSFTFPCQSFRRVKAEIPNKRMIKSALPDSLC